jgi:hypothetical protein
VQQTVINVTYLRAFLRLFFMLVMLTVANADSLAPSAAQHTVYVGQHV